MNKNKIDLSIVLPCLNEEANLVSTLNSVIRFCASNLRINNFEIILVDDGSRDNSANVINNFVLNFPNVVSCVSHKVNRGYGAALISGFKKSQYEWVFFTDSDGQFDIRDLDRLLDNIKRADFISGKRLNRQDKLVRRINAFIFNACTKIIYGTKLSDIDCAFKLFKKSNIDIHKLESTGALINAEIVYRAQKNHANFIQVPINHYKRRYGFPTGGSIRVITKAMNDFFSLRTRLFISDGNFLKFNTLLVAFMALAVIIGAVYWSFFNNYILAYGDSEAHLNIAKRIVSSLTPGLSQVGGVWLPLPHLAMLPFVWNDFLWRSGLAGSIVSALAFIWSSIILYRLSYLVTKNYLASFIGPLIFLTNPNAIYIATTPMSEILLFSLVSSSIYFFLKWVFNNNLTSLMLAALFGCLASLTRYDGWFLLILELIGIVFFGFLKNKSFKDLGGKVIIFSTLAFFGIFLWIAWNGLIFNNFLYFANSEYGSKAQQMWFYARGYLPTYKNLLLSFIYYITDTSLVIGNIISLLAITGLIFLFLKNLFSIKKNFDFRKLSLLLLFFSLLFYTISLYSGQASLIIPTFAKSWYKWDLSNVRYGVQMLLPVGVFLSLAVRKWKPVIFLTMLLILVQSFMMIKSNNVIVFNDGTRGLSSQLVSKGPDAIPLEKWLSTNYTKGLVLMDDYRRPISPVSSGIAMSDFISVGNQPYWKESLENPTKWADWVILQKADTDAVWRGLVNKEILASHYSNVFRSGNLWVFKKRTSDIHFVQRESQKLTLRGKKFTFRGVNIYDLLELDKASIKNLFENLKTNNLNTVRFWAFNKNGTLANDNYEKFDFALEEAKNNSIYLMPVLGNQWDDYGGPSNFTQTNSSDFFLDKSSLRKFQNHAYSIINHVNKLSDVAYKNDSTILAWEILNEPRNEKYINSELIKNWTEEMSQYIAYLDSNHLISIGTEGFMKNEEKLAYNENHGADLNDICSIPTIDLCSVHLYPKYLKTLPNDSDLEKLFTTWQTIADINQKPIYIGEVGFDLTDNSSSTRLLSRENYFKNIVIVADRKDFSGVLYWNLALKSDSNFSLSFNNSNDKAILGLLASSNNNQGNLAKNKVDSLVGSSKAQKTYTQVAARGSSYASLSKKALVQYLNDKNVSYSNAKINHISTLIALKLAKKQLRPGDTVNFDYDMLSNFVSRNSIF